MFYQLKPTFEAVQEKPAEGVPWVEVITQQEMDSQVTQHPYLARSLRHGHNCKAELFDHCAAGALLVPRKRTLAAVWTFLCIPSHGGPSHLCG